MGYKPILGGKNSNLKFEEEEGNNPKRFSQINERIKDFD